MLLTKKYVDKLLKDIYDLHTIKGCIIASIKGIPICSLLPQNIDERKISILATVLLSISEMTAKEFKLLSDPTELASMMKFGEYILTIVRIGGIALLITLNKYDMSHDGLIIRKIITKMHSEINSILRTGLTEKLRIIKRKIDGGYVSLTNLQELNTVVDEINEIIKEL